MKKLIVLFLSFLAVVSFGDGQTADQAFVRGHENIEWSIGYAFHLTDANKNLPRVLLVGDSICNGYQGEVQSALNGLMSVSYWVSSYCVTSPRYLKLLEFYLEESPYEVVHFNNGLHSLGTPDAAWEKGFRSALRLIREKQPRAKIIFTTSTPLKEADKTAKAKALNEIGRRVAKEEGEELEDDLFSLLDPFDRNQNWSDVFHHKPALRRLEAEQVATACAAAAGINTAIVPRGKIQNDSYDFYARHAKVLAQQKKINPQIVFVGDSITHFWCGRQTVGAADDPDTLPRWKKVFGGYRTLNLGFGWDRTCNVLWRLNNGEMAGLDPQLIVLHIGGNNYTTTKEWRGNSAEEVKDGILAVLKKLHAMAPKARVVVMGVFPFGERPDNSSRVKAVETNRLLAAEIGNFPYAEFLDITAKQIGSDGRYPKSLAGDFVHPTDAGYDIWAEALRPYLEKYVK